MEKVAYRGKHFTLPSVSAREPIEIVGDSGLNQIVPPEDSPIIRDLNTVWDTKKFLEPRKPISLGRLVVDAQKRFSRAGVPRTLDMPIKFPGSEFRIPRIFEQFLPVIERVAAFEAAINPCYDEYYCYLTVDQAPVQKGKLQREAPCHVDGFQGALWKPKVKINHSYVVSDCIPTTYYPQPFDFSELDEATHNYFWEMNREVARTNSVHAWQPQPYEINMIDAYTVHRGSPASEDMIRTWIRLSFEVRIFNRLGNAHNPLFKYAWEMQPRDIEGLQLAPFDANCDPTLRVFPWQKPDGTPYEDPKQRTQPNLKPQS